MNSTLKAHVVRRYPTPSYPCRPDVLRDPALLAERLPGEWRRAEIAGAVGAFLALTGPGCRPTPAPEEAANAGPPVSAVVAPLFEHGEGRGAGGCVVVAAPVFLSEEEAFLVIREVLEEHGLVDFQRDVILEKVIVPVNRHTVSVDWVTGAKNYERSEELKPIEADLVDGQRGVAVEFVSSDDHVKYAKDDEQYGTVYGFNYKSTAKRLGDLVHGQGTDLRFAAFYDPLVTVDFRAAWSNDQDVRQSYEQQKQKARDEARALLRAQVLDFVQWLEGQGAT